ncbi:unnamed protein product [Periconia digitata]|uniref:endo-1,3(4)-beta-glucanase n=1 Tax=Periconia digitata TaxID=1303443 RepID=A0A9W4U7E0_9PLEO|nr:unnamed protein product [Periconia digitata]
MHFTTLVSAAAFTSTALAGYVLEDDYMSKDFYSEFSFFTGPDPTNGFVNYVDQSKGKSMGLFQSGKASWGVDTKSKDPGGRASIRLESKKTYNKGLIVIDVAHMPFGCGTWPAFWTFGPNWPNSGEIDIIEGVHDQESNAIALHTSSGCKIGNTLSAFTGTVKTPDCDVKAANQDENAGCGVDMKDKGSYGKGLNDNGGGVYATEWTSDHIQVFFFPRGKVPSDVLGDAPNPSSWGKPAVKFEKSGCDIDKFFKNQKIIFDTTFCGDWAGNTWSTSSCKSKAATCNAFVQNNPEAFKNAFWDVKALKVYTNDGSAASKPSSSAGSSKSSAAPSKSKSSAAESKTSSSAAASKSASSASPGVSESSSSDDAPRTTTTTRPKPSTTIKTSSKSNIPHPNTPIGPGASLVSTQAGSQSTEVPEIEGDDGANIVYKTVQKTYYVTAGRPRPTNVKRHANAHHVRAAHDGHLV